MFVLLIDARFRVVDEVFVDLTPTGPESSADTSESVGGEKKCPYTLIVSTNCDEANVLLAISAFI